MTKILVIEDEVLLREEVVDWLTFEGHEVLVADDGMAGVGSAQHHLPDLILCDITMPNLNGYGVLLEMRSDQSTAQIPFIFMTARAAHDDIRRGMELGADDYITKPFTRAELLQTIHTRLEKKAAQENSQQQQVEELQKALVHEHESRLLQARLVAMFSHDFRNPLTAILSSSNLLRDYADRLDERHRLSHLDRVERSVRQLLQMLDDMLVVAQMETGNLDPTLVPMDVGECIRDIVQEFETIYGERYHLLFENDVPNFMMADARLLRQIAANLISNAIKYSPQGSSVRVTLAGDDVELTLSVQDQGIGIPEADQTRLFGGFQRGSNVGHVSGTGLGLAIVKQAVELQHGSISLDSQVGTGTTVTVTIPCVVAEV